MVAAIVALIVTPGVRADPPSAADVIREVQHTYRAAPTCERVQVELRYPAPPPAIGTRAARSSLVVRVAPKATGEGVESLALELGQLRIWAGGGSFIAAHERDPATFFQATLAPTLNPKSLAELMPPVLLPELDLASNDPETPCASFWPYATEITWQTVEPDAKIAGRRIVRATCAGGTIAMTIQNQRLRTLVIDLTQKKTTLTLAFSPFIPCEPARWPIEVTKRARVDSLDELRPRSGTLRVGFRVPPMPMTKGTGEPWDLGALLQPPASAPAEKPAPYAVLVFDRAPVGANASGERRFKVDELAPILERMRADAFKPRAQTDAQRDPAAAIARFGFAPVFVMAAPKPDDILARLKTAPDLWSAEGGVLWTTEAKSTIDLFAPGAEHCCVIVDQDFVLRAVVLVDPSQTAEQIADQITAALFDLGGADK